MDKIYFKQCVAIIYYLKTYVKKEQKKNV